jgi:hypothetical protein
LGGEPPIFFIKKNLGGKPMRIDQSSLSAEVFKRYKARRPDKEIHVLRSYGTRDQDDQLFRTTLRDQCATLDLDSGAFSLNNSQKGSGPDITFVDYLYYAKTYESNYDRIYNFDCDFGDEGFDTNIFYQKRMENAGLKPVPVVHSIYNDEIEYYIESGYKTVALGSTQITNFETLAYVMDKFKGTETKIHLFGSTNFEYLTSFPIYSCDASTWIFAGIYGDIKWWNPHKKRQNMVEYAYLEEMIPPKPNAKPLSEHKYQEEINQYLNQELGITEDDLLGPDGSYFKGLVNLHYYIELEEVINQIHREKGFWTAE